MVDKVIPINGKPEIRPVMNIMATIDHRFIDGKCQICQMRRSDRESKFEIEGSFKRFVSLSETNFNRVRCRQIVKVY